MTHHSYPCQKGKWWANKDHTVRDYLSYAVVPLLGHKHDNLKTASLIAAAPDLLEACKAAEVALRDGGTFPIKGALWTMLREAIAKASPNATGGRS
jgi:hypothetical protein